MNENQASCLPVPAREERDVSEPQFPFAAREALALAERIEAKYPTSLEREEAQDALVQLAKIVRHDNARLVCSWCGEDFEQGDWASTDCCNCDPVPVSALPSLLKDARREAAETLDAWANEEDEGRGR